jgi:hypothetical protein
VQEGGAAARQAGDEDRPFNRLPQDVGIARLGVPEVQQIGEETHHVPPRRRPPHQAECSLVHARSEQPPQRVDERGVAELVEPSAPAGERQQRFHLQRSPQQPERIRHAIGEGENQTLQRQTQSPLAAPLASATAGNTFDPTVRLS